MHTFIHVYIHMCNLPCHCCPILYRCYFPLMIFLHQTYVPYHPAVVRYHCCVVLELRHEQEQQADEVANIRITWYTQRLTWSRIASSTANTIASVCSNMIDIAYDITYYFNNLFYSMCLPPSSHVCVAFAHKLNEPAACLLFFVQRRSCEQLCLEYSELWVLASLCWCDVYI